VLKNKIEIVRSSSSKKKFKGKQDRQEIEIRKTRNAQKNIFYEDVKMYNSLSAIRKQYDRHLSK